MLSYRLGTCTVNDYHWGLKPERETIVHLLSLTIKKKAVKKRILQRENTKVYMTTTSPLMWSSDIKSILVEL